MAPASTGRERRSKMVVISTDQPNNGVRSNWIPNLRKLPNVLMKLTAPKRDETPAKWREKIAKSTEGPEWAIFILSGGYTVQPVPAPDSTKDLLINSNSAGSKNQNLILLSRGNAISGAPNIKGISQFPNPPIKIGITIKKIITKACAVTITLYNWSSPNNDPGCPNSIRINILKPVPNIPLQAPVMKYSVPIFLWLQDQSHLERPVGGLD